MSLPSANAAYDLEQAAIIINILRESGMWEAAMIEANRREMKSAMTAGSSAGGGAMHDGSKRRSISPSMTMPEDGEFEYIPDSPQMKAKSQKPFPPQKSAEKTPAVDLTALPEGIVSVEQWGKTICTLPKVQNRRLTYEAMVSKSSVDAELKSYLKWVMTSNMKSAKLDDLKGYLLKVKYEVYDAGAVMYPGSAEVAAMGAAFSVNEAGDRLVDIEQIYNAIVDKIPENATVWQHLMQPLFVGQSLVGSVGLLENTTTTSTMFPMFTAQEAKARLELLKSGAQELSTAATALHQQWASEISSGARLLPPKLQNLQEIDRLTGESTKNATFDVVRMAQAITWKLSHELSDMKNSVTLSLDDKETRMGELLQRIGSMALILLGTWGNSWYHGIDWRLKCQVREGDELLWPPLMTGSALGGAQPPPGAIPVAEAKNRLWKNFEEVAQSCFSYADELLLAISTRTTTTASTTPAPTTSTTPTTSPTTPAASTTEDCGVACGLTVSIAMTCCTMGHC
eukprot:s61_g36.t3